MAAWNYAYDAWQRSVLFLELLRARGNLTFLHEREGMPPVLTFDYEIVLDGRTLPRPCNYALLRIIPPDGTVPDAAKRPFVVIDPRAGHGPGIGGFKIDSEIGIALRGGHPCYFVSFFPVPCHGQTIESVTRAEAAFLDEVAKRHPGADGKPFVIGNCQGGWAAAILAATRPELVGPLLLAGSPLAYWSGLRGVNPMRYSGGILGGTWLASLASDLGNGVFDGAWLVQNFEQLNPANTYWKKLYDVYADVDHGGPRFLEFERWWGGHFFLNKAEIEWITQELFVGNHLTAGEVRSDDGGFHVNLRNIRSPIIVFASWGDNITPPPQALNWIPDLYASVDDIVANEQVIVYCLHKSVGHLGIFVSSAVANREHAELVSALDLIDMLPPGLYEVLIEDVAPEMSHQELLDGRYIVRFAPRTVADVLALDDGRDDEAPFEVVRRLSEINQRMYDTFVSPVVKAVTTEVTARAIRQTHPTRLERSVFSDGNPWMAWIAAMAPTVEAARKPVAPDNPFMLLEKQVSARIEQTLDHYRDQRDAFQEQWFEAVYGTPWLATLLGIDPAGRDRKRAPNSTLRHELAVRKAAEVEAGIANGTPFDAFIRILLYVGNDGVGLETRPFHLMRRMVKETMKTQPTQAEFKAVVWHQAAALRVDLPAALAALPGLIGDVDPRKLMAAVHEILTVARPLGGLRRQRYHEVCELLGVESGVQSGAKVPMHADAEGSEPAARAEPVDAAPGKARAHVPVTAPAKRVAKATGKVAAKRSAFPTSTPASALSPRAPATARRAGKRSVAAPAPIQAARPRTRGAAKTKVKVD